MEDRRGWKRGVVDHPNPGFWDMRLGLAWQIDFVLSGGKDEMKASNEGRGRDELVQTQLMVQAEGTIEDEALALRGQKRCWIGTSTIVIITGLFESSRREANSKEL
jgi:hypothetical protein